MTAVPLVAAGPSARDECRRALVELARADRRIVCVDSDTGGLEDAFADLPDQYVNVGIAEASLISTAAGLATIGLLPFAHTISSFATARACEQIRIDVAGNHLPVRIVVSHGGLSAGHYGPTHHAVDDVGIMRLMPGMTVVVPADARRAGQALRALATIPGPAFLRLGRSATPDLAGGDAFTLGRADRLVDGDDLTIVAAGPYPVLRAVEAAGRLAAAGLRARVLDMHTIKPLDVAAILDAARETAGIVTVEDHLVVGGLGGAVAEFVGEASPCPVRRIGIPDEYRDVVGDEEYLLDAAGVTVDRIATAALRIAG